MPSRNPSRFLPRACAALLLACLGEGLGLTRVTAAAPSGALTDWPTEAAPTAVGRTLASKWVAHELEYRRRAERRFVIYPEVCTWYGALMVAGQLEDAALRERLVRKFDPLRGVDADRISFQPHVDYRVFGILPLELYRQTGAEAMRALGLHLADAQWADPTEDGITREARYWIDDMYMITAVQVQAFRATGETRYLDRAAATMEAYLERLQQANGLFFHAPDSPFYWGRGNGWVAAGAAELLRSLPPDHPRHAGIVAAVQQMCATLLALQGADGLWRQLLDRPDAWSETSCSAMFAFTFVSGVKDGWLDPSRFAPAARRAWIALCGRLNEAGEVSDVCVGTNKAFQVVGADLEDQERFYLERPRRTGDLHGQAPLLWTAGALLR